jgi:hypothetical protein
MRVAATYISWRRPNGRKAESQRAASPELNVSVVKDKGHEVALQVVPFAREQQHAIPGLRAEFQLQLHVLIGRVKGGKSQPTESGEAGRSDFYLCN